MSSLYPWRLPSPFCSTLDVLEKTHPLMVMNSLTRKKVRFIPSNSERVVWYQCGPTVYAESHLGHARTYVSLDSLRRIMKDYLGYNVILCQNITDIDDKIIIRSSERNIPFRDLAAMYEKEFLEDMATLGVQLPDIMTRVSEYVPEIIAYVQKLIDRGIAYESNGSVYFNTDAYSKCGHTYGKLMPEQIGNSALLAEGEGSLTVNDDKKNAGDFVLWKKTKVHTDGVVEPHWESPWGNGRPGWHIECSAMSGSALRKFGDGLLDIHAGGVDLKFPHHENEIAQSEGHENCNQWTNYWLHTGHLNIQGSKMSKSLKNFKTIRAALEVYTARQIRFLCLLHKYNDPMDYDDDTMTQACNIEKIFIEYFHNIKAYIRRSEGVSGNQHVGSGEETLLLALERVKKAVHEAILDDFDTPKAIGYLSELVRECNRSIESNNNFSSVVLLSVAKYVTYIFRMFGIITSNTDSIGFTNDSGGADKEQLLTPVLNVITKFRELVRIAAINGDCKQVLQCADDFRDLVLPELGIRMEDKGSGVDVVTVWKMEDPEVLRKERALKEEAKQAKERQREEALKKQKEREEKAKIAPEDMFKGMTDLYSQFDPVTGIPTHDKATGEPVSKSVSKKLQKEWEKQKEIYTKYQEKSL